MRLLKLIGHPFQGGILLSVVFLMFFVTSSLSAQESYRDVAPRGLETLYEKQQFETKRLGWKIIPNLSYGGQYSTNFFLTEDDPDREFLHVVSPGVQAALDSSRHTIRTEYNFFFSQAQDTQSFRRFQHRFTYNGQHNLSRRLRISLYESFVFIDDPNFIQRGFFTGREQYYQNIARPTVSYFFGRRSQISMGYYNQYLDFTLSNSSDLVIHGGHVSFGYQINPKNRLSLSYRLRYNHFLETNTNDYLNHTVDLAWKHEFSPYFFGALSGGIQVRKYRAGSALTNFVDGGGGILLNLKTPRQTEIEFSSRYGRNALGNGFSFRVISNDFKWKYRLLRRLYFSGQAFYQFDDFETPSGVEEHIYGVSPKIQYRISKWIFIEAIYDFVRRSSDLADASYTAHTAVAKIGTLYPFGK